MADVLVTLRLFEEHIEGVSIQNIFPNNASMKNRKDLNLSEIVYTL